MGIKADEALELASVEDLVAYLGANHAAYIQVADEEFYLTDCNEHYWRVQYTDQLNDKGHYVDASELVPTASEFIDLVFKDGKCLRDVFPEATFYASVKE